MQWRSFLNDDGSTIHFSQVVMQHVAITICSKSMIYCLRLEMHFDYLSIRQQLFYACFCAFRPLTPLIMIIISDYFAIKGNKIITVDI